MLHVKDVLTKIFDFVNNFLKKVTWTVFYVTFLFYICYNK